MDVHVTVMRKSPLTQKESNELFEPTCYEENDHWRIKFPWVFSYPRGMNLKHFKTEEAAQAVISAVKEEREKQQVEAARRNAVIVEISREHLAGFLNHSIVYLSKNKEIADLMFALLENYTTLVIRK